MLSNENTKTSTTKRNTNFDQYAPGSYFSKSNLIYFSKNKETKELNDFYNGNSDVCKKLFNNKTTVEVMIKASKLDVSQYIEQHNEILELLPSNNSRVKVDKAHLPFLNDIKEHIAKEKDNGTKPNDIFSRDELSRAQMRLGITERVYDATNKAQMLNVPYAGLVLANFNETNFDSFVNHCKTEGLKTLSHENTKIKINEFVNSTVNKFNLNLIETTEGKLNYNPLRLTKKRLLRLCSMFAPINTTTAILNHSVNTYITLLKNVVTDPVRLEQFEYECRRLLLTLEVGRVSVSNLAKNFGVMPSSFAAFAVVQLADSKGTEQNDLKGFNTNLSKLNLTHANFKSTLD